MQEHVRLLKCKVEYSRGKGKEIGNDFCMKSRRILNVYGTLMAPKLYWVPAKILWNILRSGVLLHMFDTSHVETFTWSRALGSRKLVDNLI